MSRTRAEEGRCYTYICAERSDLHCMQTKSPVHACACLCVCVLGLFLTCAWSGQHQLQLCVCVRVCVCVCMHVCACVPSSLPVHELQQVGCPELNLHHPLGFQHTTPCTGVSKHLNTAYAADARVYNNPGTTPTHTHTHTHTQLQLVLSEGTCKARTGIRVCIRAD